MNDKVISLHGDSIEHTLNESTINIPVGAILKEAEDANLDSVVIIGDVGDSIYLTSSLSNLPKIVYLLELAKHRLLSGGYDE